MRVAVAHTEHGSGGAAGRALGAQLHAELEGPPGAVLVFSSGVADPRSLLEGLAETSHAPLVCGGTTSGGFTSSTWVQSSACAVGLRGHDVSFSGALGRNLSTDRAGALEALARGFAGPRAQGQHARLGIVLVDGRVDRGDDLVRELTMRTMGRCLLVGGGTATDLRVVEAQVFFGVEALEDAAVVLEICSPTPLGIGVCRSWTPASAPMRVTEVEGKRLVSLNAIPAADMIDAHARNVGEAFDPRQPLSFFLRNVLGIELGNDHKIRIPTRVLEDGSILCAAEIPEGATVRFMRTSAAHTETAAIDAVLSAKAQLAGRRVGAAIFFESLAARMRGELGSGYDLRGLERALSTTRYAGLCTAGQLVRGEGELGAFHNSTPVVLLLPE